MAGAEAPGLELAWCGRRDMRGVTSGRRGRGDPAGAIFVEWAPGRAEEADLRMSHFYDHLVKSV